MIPALKRLTGEAECKAIMGCHGRTQGKCPGYWEAQRSKCADWRESEKSLSCVGEVVAFQVDMGWEEKANVVKGRAHGALGFSRWSWSAGCIVGRGE